MNTAGIFATTLVAAVLVSWITTRNRRSPLRSIPGPWLAKYTNAWRFFDVWLGRADLTQQALHKKHGRYVRLGPNFLSITDPDAIRDVYAFHNAHPKSEFYSVGDVVFQGKRKPTVFTARDESWHSRAMRPVSKFYNLNSVLEYEYLMDRTIKTFLTQLNDRFLDKPVSCDMDNWLHYYAWDVIGEVTFSRRMGFLETGSDVGGLLQAGKGAFDYLAAIGQMPWLDVLLDKNPYLRVGPPTFEKMVSTSAEELFGRLGGQRPRANDFLDRFIDAQGSDPDIVDQDLLFMYTLINVAAGSDTTAIALRSALYFILKHPKVQQRLGEELVGAGVSSPVSWEATQRLPYLDAVLRESMRLHPAVALPLERIVDSRGLNLPNGMFVPPGFIVDINPSTIHRDEKTFGPDADDFRPERWIRRPGENDENFRDRRTLMERATFTFGFGSRMCIGRHIALMEVYKGIASLFASYKMRLARPDEEWKVHNSFFSRQSGIEVFIRSGGHERRRGGS